MSVIHAPESAYAKELWKWDHTVNETNPVDGTIRGLRPVGFQEYPKMLVRGVSATMGARTIEDTIVVGNPQEESNARSMGFCLTQQDALDAAKALEQDVARAAAERAYADKLMTAKAQREAAMADEATDQHLGIVPETAIRRGPGRPRKDEP